MEYNKTLSAQLLERSPGLQNEIETTDMYTQLKNSLKTIEIDNVEYYIAEGDLLLDKDELLIHSYELEAKYRLSNLSHYPIMGSDEGILGIVNNGKIVRWAPGKILTYCVLKSTFRDDEDYKVVKRNMRKATKDWEEVCGIRFKYLSDFDNSPEVQPEEVVFPVRGINSRGKFIASAFFPTYPRDRWSILIDHSYFSTSYNKTGVLRHELGHVLGLRHEHIRSGAPSSCPGDSSGTSNTIDLTQYDPKSVMHYFCGGVGSKKLAISELDIKGAQKIYGLPHSDFDYIG